MVERAARLRLPATSFAAAEQALSQAHQLLFVRRGLRLGRGARPASSRVASLAIGAVAALVLAAAMGRLISPDGEIGVRAAPPRLTFNGMNDLAPLRNRLSGGDAPPVGRPDSRDDEAARRPT